MILPPEEIIDYLLKTGDYRKNHYRKTIDKLDSWKSRKKLRGLSPIDHLFIEHQIGQKSLARLSDETEISNQGIANLFEKYNLPYLTHTEAVRKARISPAQKIQGYRSDIERTAKTDWEANLGRIIAYSGRTERRGKVYELTVPERLQTLFKSGSVKEKLDFLVKDPRGNLVGYKIVPKYQKKTYAKAELSREQHGIRVKIITERQYKRLEERFRGRIEQDERFSGWETAEDNLRTNPSKYQ